MNTNKKYQKQLCKLLDNIGGLRTKQNCSTIYSTNKEERKLQDRLLDVVIDTVRTRCMKEDQESILTIEYVMIQTETLRDVTRQLECLTNDLKEIVTNEYYQEVQSYIEEEIKQ